MRSSAQHQAPYALQFFLHFGFLHICYKVHLRSPHLCLVQSQLFPGMSDDFGTVFPINLPALYLIYFDAFSYFSFQICSTAWYPMDQ